MSKVYSFKTIQQLPISLDAAWDFFSSPANLKKITPANMGFNVVSKYHGEKMYPGQIIEYKVSPVLGILWMNSALGLIACGITSIILKQLMAVLK